MKTLLLSLLAAVTATAAEPRVPSMGRPARIVTLSFPAGRELQEIARLVDAEAARGTDLIVLPETWTGDHAEALDGPATTTMAELASKHRTYIVSPIYRREGSDCYNSAILLDREGKIACVYDKVFPWFPEFKRMAELKCGREATVFQTDFGRVGLAICFDVNFPELWQRMADQDAELVIWPSAYPGRLALQAHAALHHYSIVSATHNARETTNCPVYDITGEPISGPGIPDKKTGGVTVARFTLDLGRRVFADDYDYLGKARQLIQQHPDEIALEKTMPHEGWFVIKAIAPGVSVSELARRAGLPTLRESRRHDREELARRRGADFGSAPNPTGRTNEPER